MRFEPGDTKEVELTEYGSLKIVHGFNGLVNGKLITRKQMALKKARKKGFKGIDKN